MFQQSGEHGGNTEDERSAFLVNFRDTSVEVVKFGINFIPFISDGADLLTQLYNQAVGNDVNATLVVLASAGLALDLLTGGVGDITAVFKGFYKFSLNAGTGSIARVISETIENSISAGKGASAVIQDLTELFGVTFRVFRECGFSCFKDVDELLDDLVAQTGESVSAMLAQFRTSLTDATTNGISARCFIGATSGAAGTFLLPVALEKLFGVLEENQTLVQTQQAQPPLARCGYSAFRTRIKNSSNKYTGISSDELSALSPHHIVPKGAKANRYCIRSGDPTNVCDGARQILADANISLEDPSNGVLLSWNYRRNKNPGTYTAYDAEYPSALPHDGTVHSPEYYGAVFDTLRNIRNAPDFPTSINDFTPTQREQLQNDVRQALQRIRDANLNGQIVPNN